MLHAANTTLRCWVFSAQSTGLTDRIVKYDANRAAKNISSLESQMIVPTLTMLGRSEWPWSREAGIVVEAVATGAIMSRARRLRAPRPPGGHRIVGALGPRPILAGVVPPLMHGFEAGEEALPRWTLGRVLTEWDLLSWATPRDPPHGGALPVGRGAAAPARRPVARRPDPVVRGRRDGLGGAGRALRLRGVRRHAAERAHGPAHDPDDGRAAGDGARRSDHAGAAHAARRPRRVAARRCSTPAWRRCSPSRR